MRAHKYSDVDELRDPVTGRIDRAELRRRVKGWLAVALAFGVLLGGGGYAATKGYEAYTAVKTAKDFPGPGGDEIQVVIPRSSSALQIGKILVDAGVVKDAKTFQDAGSMRPDLLAKVQAGKYRLNKTIPALTALQELADPGRAIRVWLQLREGQRLDPQQITAIAQGAKLRVNDVTAYLTKTKPSDMGLPAWAPSKAGTSAVEGFLFPDKYEVPDGVKVDAMVKTITAQFNAEASKLDFYNAAQALDFGPQYKGAPPAQKAYLALVVASIIEREVSLPQDRAKVARVIYNRLAKGMKLELDSTVAYSVKKLDTIFTSAADRGAGNRSPYNTYQVKGLPPGPISAPAEAAMAAALNPEPGDWLYFMPINLDTGETVFSSDLAGHAAAQAQFQAWCNASPDNLKKCK
jgi:UPF0755 protein